MYFLRKPLHPFLRVPCPCEAPPETESTQVYGRFPKFHRVFFGPRPWHIEIRHRVKTQPQLICLDLRLSN